MCKEGGCGTCLVQAKLYEPITMETKSYAVNSVGCLLKSLFLKKGAYWQSLSFSFHLLSIA